MSTDVHTGSMTETLNATFETLYDAEQDVRTNHALAAMGSDLATRSRGEANLVTARARLNALLDALTMEQARAFGEWRKALLAR